MSVCNILTLFNIGGVHNVFTLVMFLMFWYLVALVGLLVMATRTTSATRYQNIRNMTSVNTLWTPPILKSVSMLHTLIVRRYTLRLSIAPMLLVMTLMWSIKDIPMVQSAMTRRTNSATRSPSHRSTRSARRLL